MAGRPKVYTAKKIEEIRQMLEEYIKNEDLPQVSEFCYLNDINQGRITELSNENELFSKTIKKLYDKLQSQLWKLSWLNIINPSAAIFRLKNKPFNYSDKQEITVTEAPTLIRDDI